MDNLLLLGRWVAYKGLLFELNLKALVALARTTVNPIGWLLVSRLLAVTDFAPPFLQTCSEVGEVRCEFSPWRGPLRKDEDSSFSFSFFEQALPP